MRVSAMGRGALGRAASVLALAGLAACDQAPETAERTDAADTGCDAETLQLHVASPDWRDQIIYMALIDRFDDGDPANNDLGRGEFELGSPAHFNGGDLAGLSKRIDYIRGLGATSVWVSPPVENQIWSSIYAAAGWHGYWATDFSRIDPHFGTLQDYRRLSHDLHCRGMYLIQDIVVNHTGNFFGWDGDYDPDDTAKNFVLLEDGTGFDDRPTQAPFDKVDRRDPDHATAAIYNWTPPIRNYSDPIQEKTWQLGNLADLNTENPVVVAALKDIYGDWIDKAGIDGFRIDTARYVDQPFWHAFMHDADGVAARAAATGRNDFLAFGETAFGSEPFETEGEVDNISYLGTADEPGINSVLGFPLYYSSLRVFGEGAPTSQMGFRLTAMMDLYPDPFIIPNFIDNHDTARFLSQGNRRGFEQALLMLYTVPGIPVVYQGTEQELEETRQTLFAGGFGTATDQFDTTSPGYQRLAALAKLRLGNPVFTRGDLTVLASEASGPGVLAYRRSLEDDHAIVLMNTARHAVLAYAVDTGLAPGTRLAGQGQWSPDAPVVVDQSGAITVELPPHAAWVLVPADRADQAPSPVAQTITIDQALAGTVQTAPFQLSGAGAPPEGELLIMRNNRLDAAMSVRADGQGRWSAPIAVANFGREANTLQVYAPAANRVSPRIAFETMVDAPAIEAEGADAAGDDHGPTGTYIRPQQQESGAQKDIVSLSARAGGANLELTITMAQVTDVWLPVNGFDNLIISVFIDLPDRDGISVLPQLDATLPDGAEWDLSHIATGWASAMYDAAGASAHDRGDTLGIAPRLKADKATNTITIRYSGAPLGVSDWAGATFYVTTWDPNQEGGYVDVLPEPANWTIGGAPPGSPRIMDDARLTIADAS